MKQVTDVNRCLYNERHLMWSLWDQTFWLPYLNYYNKNDLYFVILGIGTFEIWSQRAADNCGLCGWAVVGCFCSWDGWWLSSE